MTRTDTSNGALTRSADVCRKRIPFTQPARRAAEYGLVVDAFPAAGKNRPFGFDVQVRQAGRLLARARRAGRCVDTPRNGGFVHSCKVARSSTMLR